MMAFSLTGENTEDIFSGMNPFFVSVVTNDHCLAELVMCLPIASKDHGIFRPKWEKLRRSFLALFIAPTLSWNVP
jgi:hypothetical protein